MASLQKFKILATQCGVAGSPTRSPTTSPVIHLRRRKTLRMLLARGGGGESRRLSSRCDDGSSDRSEGGSSPERGKELSVRHKLKDLFVSSPPAFGQKGSENATDGLLPSGGGGGGGGGSRKGGTRSLRPLSATFRQRLLRRAWRPMLVAIPE